VPCLFKDRMIDPIRSSSEPPRLPRRDFIVLPLLSFLTVLVMFGVSEIVTRLIWPARYDYACNIDDSVDGDRFKPNCTVRGKIAEGPWVTYHFNECGYRSDTSCGPKPPGTVRIAILGSSISQALYVPYEDTFFSRASSTLRLQCKRPVDVQNLGVPGSSPVFAYRRVPEALALKPDLVIYLVVPWDLYQEDFSTELAEGGKSHLPSAPAKTNLTPLNRIERWLIQSRTVLMAQHFMLQDKAAYILTYMLYGDKADFLRQPFTPTWQRRFADFDLMIARMAEKMKAADVPFMIIPVPSRAEAALLSSPHLPPHVDPFAFGHQIETIASKHGVSYLDLMQTFSQIPNAERLYYVVDGHGTAEAQKVIAEKLVEKLQDGSVAAFSHCVSEQAERSR
jgi:hypothetical protein